MSKQILILAGDGIGPEIVAAAEKVLTRVNEKFALDLTWQHGLLGGAAIDAHGEPYPAVTAAQAQQADSLRHTGRETLDQGQRQPGSRDGDHLGRRHPHLVHLTHCCRS